MAAENSPQLWDALWSTSTANGIKHTWESEKSGVRWRRIKAFVEHEFSEFRDLRTIEIGAGIGTYSALMAMEGARPTI
ncbi:MAG: hypothetical protein IPP28_04515 [Xanthomonadales bacterium]|nr:hypothetical protein [Xanthomonadales bacterium]